MGGLVGLDQLSGFSDLISLFFAVMMGWVHSLSNWIWSMIRGAGAGGGSWITANWMRVLIALVVTGLALDWIIWMLRWQPYRLWFRAFRRRPRVDSDVYDQEAAVDQFAGSEESLGVSDGESAQVFDEEMAQALEAESGLTQTDVGDDYGDIYAPMLGVEYAPELSEQPDIIPTDDMLADLVSNQAAGLVSDQVAGLAADLLADQVVDQDDYRYAEPAEEYQPELMIEETEAEEVRRWPWQKKARGGVRTVTGKPAKRRGLLRLTGDDDEAIPGLPPMMTHDEGYNNPTLPPESTLSAQPDVPGIEL